MRHSGKLMSGSDNLKVGVTNLSIPRRLLHGSAGYATKAFKTSQEFLLWEKSITLLIYLDVTSSSTISETHT